MADPGQKQEKMEEAANVDTACLAAWFGEYPWLEPLDQLLQEHHGQLLRSVEERLANIGSGGALLGARCNSAPAMLLHHPRQNPKEIRKSSKEKQESASTEDISETATRAPEDAPQEMGETADSSDDGELGLELRRVCGAKKERRWSSEDDYEHLAQLRSDARQRSIETKQIEEVNVDTNCHRKLVDMVESKYFEGFFAILIITNSLVIGAQIEYSSHHVHVLETPLVFRVVERLYAFCFFVELVLRMIAGGRRFFCASDMGAVFWSYFDVMIVGSSVFELVLQIVAAYEDSAGGGGTADVTGQAKILRIVRVTRVFRVMRVLRVVKFIHALSSLISSIFYTLKSLAWSLFLLLMIIYVFGILFADTVISHVSDFPPRSELDETLQEYQLYVCFGSLVTSMHTLFRAISGGVDWGTQIDLLFHIHWAWGYLFLAYIAFCYFAVLNVMTAVFCQRAIESSRYDPDYQIQQMLAEQERCSEICGQIFMILDSITDGTITRAELMDHFDDEAVRALFQSLDLVCTDPDTLFKLLDEGRHGDVDYSEFVAGCMKMRGPAKAVDIAWMMHESTHLQNQVSYLKELLRNVGMQVSGITETLSRPQTKVMSNHHVPTSGKPKERRQDSKDTPVPPSMSFRNPPAAPQGLPPSFMVGPRTAGFGLELEQQSWSWHKQARQLEQRHTVTGLAANVEDIPYDIGPELQVHLPGGLPH